MRATVLDGDLNEELVAALAGQDAVAVDTETSGLDWRTDRLHLVQLFTAATGPVLVRVGQDRPARLCALLADPGLRKVFHFAPFDLAFLSRAWGVRVASVGCTKAASKLVDPTLPPAAHSLQPLLERELGVHVGKGAARTSDWGALELTVGQIEYAAADVLYLLALEHRLEDRLRERGRDGLYRDVCRYLPVDATLKVEGLPDPLRY